MRDSHSKKIVAQRWRRKRAHMRLRNRIQGTAERPRLSVYKSLRYIYAQVIDDLNGRTIAQANSSEAEVRESLEGSASNTSAARRVGEVIAERAKENGIERVVFDRGGFIYHGKVKALAEGARDKGLVF